VVRFAGGLLCIMKEKICEFLNWKGTHAPKAAINYKLPLERFVQVCGEKPLENYNVSDVVKYNFWLKTRFSPYHVTYSMTVLKCFFFFYREQLNYNCLSPSIIRFKRERANSHRALLEEEYKKIIAEIPTNGFVSLRDSIIIRLLWDTGVRVSELCDLNISQINPQKRSTTINTKKTRNQRIIIWSEETHQLLMKYLPIRLELEKSQRADSLFVGLKGREGCWSMRITKRTVQRMVRQYATQAGILAKVSPHSFRHGWAHKRRDQNAPLSFIQRGLGHCHPISTFVYEQYNDPEFVNYANSFLAA
jgi:site-specific recombinase XerD